MKFSQRIVFVKLFPWVFIVLVCYIYATALLVHIVFPVVILLLFYYFWCLLFKPEIALFITYLVIINGFGFINEDLLRFPYLFRLRDVCLILIFIPYLKGVFLRDKYCEFVKASKLGKIIGIMLIFFLFQIFITKMRYPAESFASFFRSGRQYLYYGLFFPSLYILLDDNRFKWFCKISLMSVSIFCILFIVQSVVGPAHRIIPFGNMGYQDIQGLQVVRMYLGGITVPALVFQVGLFLLLFGGFAKNRKWLIIVTALSGLQIILTFYRAHTAGVILGTIIVFLLIKEKGKMNIVLKGSMILISCLFVYLSFTMFTAKTNIVQAIWVRVASIPQAILNHDDTFIYRLETGRGEIAIIKQNPLLGGGFIHDESKMYAAYRMGERGQMIRAGESGLLTILFDLGIFGLLWVIFLSIIFLKIAIFIINSRKDKITVIVTYGLCAFYFGRLISFVVEPAFVGYSSLILIVLTLVLLEIMRSRSLSNV